MKTKIEKLMEKVVQDKEFRKEMFAIKKDAEKNGLSKKELAEKYAARAEEAGISVPVEDILKKMESGIATPLGNESSEQVAGGVEFDFCASCMV